jgi:hypothetical protein
MLHEYMGIQFANVTRRRFLTLLQSIIIFYLITWRVLTGSVALYAHMLPPPEQRL